MCDLRHELAAAVNGADIHISQQLSADVYQTLQTDLAKMRSHISAPPNTSVRVDGEGSPGKELDYFDKSGKLSFAEVDALDTLTKQVVLQYADGKLSLIVHQQ